MASPSVTRADFTRHRRIWWPPIVPVTGGMNTPVLNAVGLWAKTSVKGGQYLTGRLGGVKVLILENRDRQSDDDPSHHLFFAEAPDRRQGASRRVPEVRWGTPDQPETITASP